MINLISKINDRNIQRKRESGLTGYVLISALALCLYKLFNQAEFLLTDSVFERKNLNKSIELICYTFNALICLGVITYQLFPNLKTLNHIKFIKRIKADSYVFTSMVVTFFVGTILIIYLFLTKINPQNGFYLYCIAIFILNIFGWYAFVQTIKNNKSDKLKINFEPKDFKNLILTITIIVSAIIATISVIFIYNLEIDYKTQIIKIIILSYLSYAIIEKILEVNSNDLFYSKLEAFEYEIKLRNVTDNETIRKEFQERFSGFLVNDWIHNQIKLAEFRNLTFVENIENINSQLNEIDNKNFDDKNLENKLKSKLNEEKAFHLVNYKSSCSNQINILENALKDNYYAFEIYEKDQINKLLELLKKEL